MSLARVIAQHPDQAVQISDRLRALGYEVEVLAPGQTANHAADLELQLETCAVEQALARADAIARAHPQAVISVAPGVFPGVPAALATNVSPETPNSPPAVSPPSSAQPEQQAVIAPAEREHFERTMEDDDNSARARAEQAARAAAQQREAESRARAEDLRQKREQERRKQAARAAEEARRGEEERRRQAEEAERRRVVREAEIARRNREAEAEVLQMAAQTAAREDVRQSQSGIAPQPDSTPVPVATAPLAAPRLRTANAAVPRRSRRGSEFRFAVAAAAVVAVGLMIGWAAASSPRTPLSNMQSNGLEQQVPFGPVTLKASPAMTSTITSPAVGPRAVAHAVTPKPPATVRNSRPEVKNSTRTRRLGIKRSRDDGPEVTVRHFGPTPHPPHAGQQARATRKRITDFQ